MDGTQGGDQPEGGMNGQQQVENHLNPNYSTMFPLPSGEFDPRLVIPNAQPQPGAQPLSPDKQMTEVVVWAHDATVQPGKTYRYKVRYKIKNPIYHSGNVATDKTLADKYYIAG